MAKIACPKHEARRSHVDLDGHTSHKFHSFGRRPAFSSAFRQILRRIYQHERYRTIESGAKTRVRYKHNSANTWCILQTDALISHKQEKPESSFPMYSTHLPTFRRSQSSNENRSIGRGRENDTTACAASPIARRQGNFEHPWVTTGSPQTIFKLSLHMEALPNNRSFRPKPLSTLREHTLSALFMQSLWRRKIY